MSPSSHTVAQDTNAITLPPLPPLETVNTAAGENNDKVTDLSAMTATKTNNNSHASSESSCPKITTTKKRSTRSRAICTHPNCTNQVVNNHRCARHGATIKRCSAPQCTNYAQVGGVCTRHGAKKKVQRCKVAGCSNVVRNGGVCRRHGATDARREQMRLEAGLKRKRDGLSAAGKVATTKTTKKDSSGDEKEVSNSKKATTSNRRRPCSAENCPNTAYIGGVCRRHGAKVKLCSVEGCSNQAKKGGVCFRHRKVVVLKEDEDVGGDALLTSTVEDEELGIFKKGEIFRVASEMSNSFDNG